MQKSKTQILISSLTKRELKNFDKFINYYAKCKEKDVLKYWKMIYSKKNNCLKEFKNDTKFSRKILSDFNKIIEKFFIFNNIKEDEVTKILILSREFRKRNIKKYFSKLINEMKEIKSKTPLSNPKNRLTLLNINFEKYLLYSGCDDYPNLYKIAKEENKISEIVTIYSKLFEYFNRIYCKDLSNNEDEELIKIEDVIKYIKKHDSYIKENYPNIYALYLLYEILNDFLNYQKINDLLEYLKNNDKYLAEESLQFCYDSLFEFLIKFIESGNIHLYNHFYKTFLDLETRGVLKNLIHIRPKYFPIFVGMILDKKGINDTLTFINENKEKIHEDFTEQVYLISIAKVEFHKKNYNKVKEILLKIKTNDPFLYLYQKTLLIKTYFEKGEFNFLYPLSDAIKHYINRKFSSNHIINNINTFLICVSKLSSFKKAKTKSLDFVKNCINSSHYFLEKEWIAEKYKELIKEN
ncbi:MAG: hypothetical protein N2490_02465 [Ignavibacteria bacterium]|nr:hypothetical protein [Ignavibacteria bacterium]